MSDLIEAVERLSETATDAARRAQQYAAGGDRLYLALAIFDTRDGSEAARIVQAAREGWERSDPEMGEQDAWAEFDARIAKAKEPKS